MLPGPHETGFNNYDLYYSNEIIDFSYFRSEDCFLQPKAVWVLTIFYSICSLRFSLSVCFGACVRTSSFGWAIEPKVGDRGLQPASFPLTQTGPNLHRRFVLFLLLVQKTVLRKHFHRGNTNKVKQHSDCISSLSKWTKLIANMNFFVRKLLVHDYN